jgi:hypothetical protein
MGVKWRRRSHLLVLVPSLALGAFSVAGTTEVARADEASEIYLVTAAEGQLAAARRRRWRRRRGDGAARGDERLRRITARLVAR